jgi:putative ABC transport system permease protein
MPTLRWLEQLRHDITFAGRQLKRAPAFTGIAVLTLALGIGANSAIFALVDATLLRPLPFHDPGRLLMLYERTNASRRGRVSPLNMLDWNDRGRSFERIAGFLPRVGGMVLSGNDGVPETVSRQWVTAGFFDVLGVAPITGRTFTEDDNRRNANAVVLSEGFWRTRFNADPTLIGRDIRLDGEMFTVVGVMPQTFQLLGGTSIWALLPIARSPESRSEYFLQVIGRLKPGVTLDAASGDLTAVADGLAREFPATNKGRGVGIEPLHDALIGSELRFTSMLFLGVVGFVLLICCANVANLLLARATVRGRELALRAALGASRGRIVRQLLTESLVLSMIGGTLGVAIGAAILDIAPTLIPQGLLPGAITLTFDNRMIAFCAIVALGVGVLFGLAPAWQASTLSSSHVVASDSRTSTGRGGRLRGVLVTAEIATAVLLLFGAGLLLRTLMAVETVDRGYRAEDALTMLIDPIDSKYPTPAAMLQFYDEIDREVRALPGVRSAAWASTLPLGTSYAGRAFFEVVGDAPVEESKRRSADYQIVSPSYFPTLDLPIVSGRGFNDRDRLDSVPVCIVNEAFVRANLQRNSHATSPVGQRIAVRRSRQEAPVVREIIGVAKQVKGRPDETEDLLQVYVPITQNVIGDIYLVVRPKNGRAENLAASVRAAIAKVDREQLVSVRNVMTLEDVAWDATSRHRFRAALVVTFAMLALVLSMVGVFGILAYAVQQRVRDFGVRRALGASTGDVLRLVIASAARMVGAGAIIGFALSLVLGRLLTTMLFGVQPLDPTTFAAVTLVLAITATLAIAGPAWRATRIDPVVALRSE